MTYSEIELYPAQWLRNLSGAGHIAKGEVLGDIRNIKGGDLDETKQFHAFAGIGAWSYALRLAGVPDTAPIWTGSCPCQPFSVAGKGKGKKDKRHLWPEWRRLIDECRPTVIFGEQVASPLGRSWLDDVSTDLEALGYAIGSADLCAPCVGAPHARQRLFFVAYTNRKQCDWLDALLRAQSTGGSKAHEVSEATWGGEVGALGHPNSVDGRQRVLGTHRPQPVQPKRPGAIGGFWAGAEWLDCADGKTRPTQPGTFPLAHGSANRVGKLRAYGNAVVPQVAAQFIKASIETLTERKS